MSCFKILAVLLIVLGGLTPLRAQTPPAGVSATTNIAPATVRPLTGNGVSNFFRLSDRIYSGSAPEGEAGFAELKARGIKTIITVDGAKPDVETAARYGLRYVHLPIGYDGVPTNQALRLVKAAETLPGPIYVHCHHGLHRGPSGAAVICMALEGWTPEQADGWLKLAGTSTNYLGLYRSVELFRPPSTEVLKNVSADFPAKSPVSPLADVMIEIDGRVDHLKLIQQAGYKTPPANPDLDPPNEALLLHELFKELLRSPEMEKHNQDFRDKLLRAEEAANSLHLDMLMNPLDPKRADAMFQRLNDACAACHKAYRN
jgi:protein tyrosine phosphatase (PTP) superfamily phosphohydrolase (DUF442 family)